MADVLLIDDNPLMRQVLARFLGDLGYEVAEADSAAAAVALANQAPPSLFLVDLCLPDLDGADALHTLRALPGCATTPAVALSGLDESTARRWHLAGFDTYLAKPVDLDTLEALVVRYLGSRPRRDRRS